jgi:hypothetical protein
LRAVRRDGVIVKPDVPLVPIDQSILADAKGFEAPMVASTYTDFGDLKAAYVFAYPRGSDVTVSFRPNSLGFEGPVYVYDYFAHRGQVVNRTHPFTAHIAGSYGYYIVTTIGDSGIGLLGDAGLLVPLGRQRIARVVDHGVLEVEVTFAPDESSLVIQGYSPTPPVVTARKGDAEAPVYETATQLFSVSVSKDSSGTAVIEIIR